MASIVEVAMEKSLRSDRFFAKNIMKQSGESVLNRLTELLPQTRRVEAKLENGKLYSASILGDTRVDNDVINKIASTLADQLTHDEAFALVPFYTHHAVEDEELINGGMLRVISWWDVTTNKNFISFEVGAGKASVVQVTMRVTPL